MDEEVKKSSKKSNKYEPSLPEIYRIKRNPLDDLNEYSEMMCKDNKHLFKIIKKSKNVPEEKKKSRSRSKSISKRKDRVDLSNIKLEQVSKKLAESNRKEE